MNVVRPFNFYSKKSNEIFIYLFPRSDIRVRNDWTLAALKITVVVDPSFRYFHDDDNNARNWSIRKTEREQTDRER